MAPLNPARRALLDLPGLVVAAIQLVVKTAPIELSVAAGLQILIGAGTAAQLQDEMC